jgi:hypothetical protein
MTTTAYAADLRVVSEQYAASSVIWRRLAGVAAPQPCSQNTHSCDVAVIAGVADLRGADLEPR